MSQPPESRKNRRRQDRICFRTALTVISLDRNTSDIRPILTEAWTEDISLSGAQIVTKVPLEDGRVWMRFIVPNRPDQLVEAEIVRKTTRAMGNFRRYDQPLYVYGLRFSRIVEEPSVVEWLIGAIRGETPQTVPAVVRAQFEAICGRT